MINSMEDEAVPISFVEDALMIAIKSYFTPLMTNSVAVLQGRVETPDGPLLDLNLITHNPEFELIESDFPA